MAKLFFFSVTKTQNSSMYTYSFSFSERFQHCRFDCRKNEKNQRGANENTSVSLSCTA